MGKRGSLIVFEGCDRSGKTTACKRLVEYFNANQNHSAKFMRFPDRTTEVGQAIDGYLKGQRELDDHVIHLLFSANRWEKVHELKRAISEGTHVIVDRYAFSGVAFSAAKSEMDLEWCRQPDRGLPRPDIVFFLDVSGEEAQKRGGYGEERYERKEFQGKVRQNYEKLIDSYWKIIHTDSKTQDEVFQEVQGLAQHIISKEKSNHPETLWPMSKSID